MISRFLLPLYNCSWPRFLLLLAKETRFFFLSVIFCKTCPDSFFFPSLLFKKVKQLIKPYQVNAYNLKTTDNLLIKNFERTLLVAIKKVSLLEIELVLALIQSRVENFLKSI